MVVRKLHTLLLALPFQPPAALCKRVCTADSIIIEAQPQRHHPPRDDTSGAPIETQSPPKEPQREGNPKQLAGSQAKKTRAGLAGQAASEGTEHAHLGKCTFVPRPGHSYLCGSMNPQDTSSRAGCTSPRPSLGCCVWVICSGPFTASLIPLRSMADTLWTASGIGGQKAHPWLTRGVPQPPAEAPAARRPPRGSPDTPRTNPHEPHLLACGAAADGNGPSSMEDKVPAGRSWVLPGSWATSIFSHGAAVEKMAENATRYTTRIHTSPCVSSLAATQVRSIPSMPHGNVRSSRSACVAGFSPLHQSHPPPGIVPIWLWVLCG